MGAEVAVGVAIGSVVAGLVSSVATNSSNREIAEETNETSTNIAESNNATQVAMNEANNQFAHDEAELAWQRQVQYNNPVEQVKRYNEAGLNPAIMMSGSAGGSVGQTSPVAMPHGSGITPSMPNLIAAEMLDPLRGAGVADSLQKVASSMSDISSSKLSDAQKQSLLSKLDSELRAMELQNQWQEVMNAWQPYMNDAHVKLSLESAKLAAAQAIEAKNNGDLLLEKKMTEKTQRSLNKALRGVYGEQRVLLRQQNDTFMDGFRSRLKVESSQSAKNYAEAQTENELRDLRGQLLKADADVQRDMLKNNDKLRNKLQGEIEQLMWENLGRSLKPEEIERRKHAITKQLEEDAKSAEFANTWTGRFLRSLAPSASAGSTAAMIKLLAK